MQFKTFAEEIGANKFVSTCTSHIQVFDAFNRADAAAPSDAFGKALAEGGGASMSNSKTPKGASTSTVQSADSANFKRVGKAAAVMARSNGGVPTKSNGSSSGVTKSVSKSGNNLIGNALLSELMAAKRSKKAKPGASAQGVAHARSMPADGEKK